jgi:hypothetical protein
MNTGKAVVEGISACVAFVLLPLFLLPLLAGLVVFSSASEGVLLTFGIVMTTLAVLSGLTRGTRYEGLSLVGWGLASLLYLYFVLGGGELTLALKLDPSRVASVHLLLQPLLFIVSIIPVLQVVRGLIIYSSRGSPASVKQETAIENVTASEQEVPPASD